MKQQYCIYILTNEHDTVFYTGFTADLKRRVWEHKESLVAGFSKRYRTKKLVYYETCEDRPRAIEREKQVKDHRHEKKTSLVKGMNPDWQDLYEEL